MAALTDAVESTSLKESQSIDLFGGTDITDTNFTFACPSSPAMPSSLKRPNDDAAAPTPPASPAKKRARTSSTSLEPSTLPGATSLSDPFEEYDKMSAEITAEKAATAALRLAQDASVVVSATPKAGKTYATLDRFWKVETKEERAEKVSRLFEEAKIDVEKRRNDALNDKVAKIARDKENGKERARRFREREREARKAEGWVPHGDRVSKNSVHAVNDITYILLRQRSGNWKTTTKVLMTRHASPSFPDHVENLKRISTRRIKRSGESSFMSLSMPFA